MQKNLQGLLGSVTELRIESPRHTLTGCGLSIVLKGELRQGQNVTEYVLGVDGGDKFAIFQMNEVVQIVPATGGFWPTILISVIPQK